MNKYIGRFMQVFQQHVMIISRYVWKVSCLGMRMARMCDFLSRDVIGIMRHYLNRHDVDHHELHCISVWKIM
jgi:hypothetical protein